MNAIEIRGLVKNFEKFTLGPLDLNVPRGYMVGYIGENGAGKSTTIKLILGLLRPDEGSIKVLDETMGPESPEIKNRIGFVFDDLYMPDIFDIGDVDRFCGKSYEKWNSEIFWDYMARFNLPKKQKVKKFSRGMRMKLGLAMALSHNAELLILDEATSGLDPVVRDEILEILQDFLQDENHSVLISSHILSDLEKAADYIAFIHHGKLLFMENKDELRERYALCSLSPEEVAELDPEAIVGRRTHRFGQELLVDRRLMPDGIPMEKASIEDIMVYVIRGEKE